MNSPKIRTLHGIYLFIGAIFLGAMLQTLIFIHLKSEILSNDTKIDFYFSTKNIFDTSLYYSFNQKFTRHQKVDGEKLDDTTIRFHLPGNDTLVTNFRLDFDNTSQVSKISIDSLRIFYGTSHKVLFKDKIFDHIFLNSEAVDLDFRNKTIGFNTRANPNDPYIIFDPLAHILLDNHPLNRLALFFPFIIVLIVILIRERVWGLKFSVTDFLFLMFIFSIPLKIAWTTFAAILVCLWGLYKSMVLSSFNYKNLNGIFLVALFFALVIFGRPIGLKAIDHQLGLLVFSLILDSNILDKKKVAKCYVHVFLFLNALICTSAIGFLISFQDVFGLEILQYFENIKTYSGNIRDWLYYDHAAFLSFFSIMVLPLMDEMTEFNRKTRIYWLYNIFIVLTIVLMGVRISFLIYLIVLLNLYLKKDYKWSIGFNTLLFLVLTLLLFVGINKLDQNRHELWRVSWEAIKERPLFGYGLGSSDKIIHHSEFMESTGFKVPEILNHSHNQFLTMWLELGLAGIFTVLAILLIYLKQTKLYKSKPMVLFIFGTSYLFLTESVLQTSKPFFVLCFLFALFSLKQNHMDKEKEQLYEI